MEKSKKQNLNYPIQFRPILVEKIWGGTQLIELFNKDSDKENIGESWEISDVDGNISVVDNGWLKGKTLKELILEYKSELVGEKVYNQFGDQFPILIKFIDAKTPLSIQVHPSDELAKERHNSFGKNEMWYIMNAEKDSELIVGFKNEMNANDYQKSLESGTLENVLNKEKVNSGDSFYIPTGRVHAIGAGIILAEIQQTSNITYRIYDYNRVDKVTGKQRELHTELALGAIDFNIPDSYKIQYQEKENESVQLKHTPYFKTNIISLNKELKRDYSSLDSFVIFMCVEGNLEIETEEGNNLKLKKGETCLIPASITKVRLTSSMSKVLEVYM